MMTPAKKTDKKLDTEETPEPVVEAEQDEERVELNAEDLVTGRTPEERKLIARVTNNVKGNVHMDRKVNLGNYSSLGFGFSIGVPLGLTDEEFEMLNSLYDEAIQRAVDILNDQIDERVARIEAQLQVKKSK